MNVTEPTTSKKRGIAVAGNIIADIVKRVDCYPDMGMLANISAVTPAIGGCAPNTAIDLAKIDRSIPISVLGCVGDDEYGRFISEGMSGYGIDISGVRAISGVPTSFTDVMSLDGGDRTFFHARGANAMFSPTDIDISRLSCSVLHIGYILLLDCFDADDSEYGTVMARFLSEVQKAGIKTSIDVVSSSTGDFPKTIIPALKYCDYVIINEIECCNIWAQNPRNKDGSLNIPILKDSMTRTMRCGVKEKVVVHSKEAGFCLSRGDEFTSVPSLRIPTEEIRGSVGAGDAYCAGCLYGIYNRFSDKEMLEFASAAAACNLFAENAVDGMRSKDEILEMQKHYQRYTLTCLEE